MAEAPTLNRSLSREGGFNRPRDQILIDGVSLGFDEILNEGFFAPKKVEILRDAFKNNVPFQHLILEDLFSPKLLELVNSDFDRLNWSDWRRYDNANERKRGSAPKTRFGHASQLYFNTIHSGVFIDFLEQVTGITGLVPDPALFAGGLHEIPTGGKFALHTDFNQHSLTKLENRLVFITYLNKDWQPSYGGALELWSTDENKCVAEVEPVFGRSILFYQSSKSLHGHPTPVDAPNGRTRRSVAAYYYSNGRVDGDGGGFHTTLFPNVATLASGEKLTNTIKYLMPPVLLDAFRKAKSLLR
jgi:Rps23 Pro-64 3,4-dihydroxylase Tpa1-like proline 4-hydroxylase